MERPDIIKRLLSTKEVVDITSLTDEKEISYTKLLNDLIEKSLPEKIEFLEKTTDENEKIIILTSIIDRDVLFDCSDDIDKDVSTILKRESKLLKEILDIT